MTDVASAHAMRLAVAAPAVVALILSAPFGSARALEQPPAFSTDDLRLGTPMSEKEDAEAQQFCRETLAGAAVAASAIGPACACFPHEWAARTNRLHRLALPIAMAPDAPDSRRNLALIFRAQDGIDDTRLKQLSAEYQAAARQAFRACR